MHYNCSHWNFPLEYLGISKCLFTHMTVPYLLIGLVVLHSSLDFALRNLTEVPKCEEGVYNYIWWLYFFFLHKQFSLDHYVVGLGTEVEGIIQVKLEECRTIITNIDMQKEKSLVWPPFKRKQFHFLCLFHMKSFQLSCFTDRIFETVERKTQFQCCIFVLKTYWLYQPKESERRTPRWWCTSPCSGSWKRHGCNH